MKVMLIKDVYKLGRAGDVKKVANGYGCNFLIPQGLAVLATPGALKQIDHIRSTAATIRSALNSEMSGVAEKLEGETLTFPVKAGETGKLYGSITNQMIADAIKQSLGFDIDRRSIESEPIRNLGEHDVIIRLTMDLTPKVKVIVHREGEAAEEEAVEVEAEVEAVEAEAAVSEEVVAEETEPVEAAPEDDAPTEAASEETEEAEESEETE